MSEDFENNMTNFEDENSSNESDFENETLQDLSENDAYDEPETDASKKEENVNPQSEYVGQNSYPYSNTQSNQYGYNGSNYNYQNQNGYNYQNPGGYNNQNYNSQNQQNGSFRPYDFGKSNNYNSYQNNVPPHDEKKKSSTGKKVAAVIIVLAVVIGLFAAVQAWFPETNDNTEVVSPTNPTLVAQETTVQGSDDEAVKATQQVQLETTSAAQVKELSAVEVAKKARPSVVGVMTYKGGQLSGEGSGVAMGLDSTGKYTYIITCAHVINESGVTYGVRTLEGKNYTAEMVAFDVRTDIGVLRVEATDIPTAEFGDSTALEVGETVYAIGNPGGSEYFGSITNGIVSAIDRSVTGTYTMTCIQHNAAINPGNSGGALVNSAGQVIGINSSKIAATDYEGMGFAVPMSIVKPVVDSLITYKYVPNRPKLGIEYASVDSYQLYSMVVAIKGLPTGSLVIAGISEESSLANTDAQVGDLIIAVNGKKMNTSDVLLDLINTGNVGDTLTLTLCRIENRTYQTTTFDVTITLIEDKGTAEETTTAPANNGGYYYGGASSFEDFFENYFGF